LRKKIEKHLKNGEEYVGLKKTPSQNLMLDRQVLITEERCTGHRSFLP
jgi:hypothetical protein